MDSKTLARADGKHLKIRYALIEHDKDGDGVCDPALRWIAKLTGLSLSVVGLAIRKMAKLGYLSIEVRGRDSRRYHLLPSFFDVPAKQSPSVRTQLANPNNVSPSGRTEEERNPSEYELPTETVAARARASPPPEDRKNVSGGSLARKTRPRGGAQREMLLPISGGTSAATAPAVTKLKRDRWLGGLTEFVTACMPDELERFWLAAQIFHEAHDKGEPVRPPVRAYLNGLDDAKLASHWWKARQALIKRASG